MRRPACQCLAEIPLWCPSGLLLLKKPQQSRETSAAALAATKEICINETSAPNALHFPTCDPMVHRPFALTRLRFYVCTNITCLANNWLPKLCQQKINASVRWTCQCKSGTLRIPPWAELLGRVETSASHACDRRSLLVHVSAAEMLGCSSRGPGLSVAEGPEPPKGTKCNLEGTCPRNSPFSESLQPRSYKAAETSRRRWQADLRSIHRKKKPGKRQTTLAAGLEDVTRKVVDSKPGKSTMSS